ncbi:MAG: cation diffusion facilitator family transporter [Verrucomicrobia bacterium]|nr:cation diffusion facilitator family transporter [Verrucomicrobiota bacterium]
MQSRLKRSLRVTFLGMALNVLLAAVKLVAGVVGHSHALVADAVESFADVCSSLVVWRGLVVASVPPDEDHPYGHGKAEAISAAIVAAMLLVAALWIAVKSVMEIIAPHEAPAPFTLVVLVGVVVIKEALFRFALREASAVDSPAVRSDAWHHRSDAITSLAAGLGISVALMGGEGFAAADDVAALFASGIIFWNGWRLFRPALDELMDASADPGLIRRITVCAEAVPHAGCVEKCLVRRMGGQFLVDMHLQVDPNMTVKEAHRVGHEVKDAVRREHPSVLDVLVHVEPLGGVPGHTSSSGSDLGQSRPGRVTQV